MGKKIDENVAVALMLNAGYRPLEPYKSVDTPWKSECVTCRRVVQPNLGNVKSGHSSCAYCAGTRVDVDEAIVLLSERNLKPLEPFKGVMSPWKCVCLVCGDIVKPNLNSLKRGQGGCIRCGYVAVGNKARGDENQAIKIMVEAGVKPLTKFKSSKTPWKSECLTCGKIVSPTLGSIKAGQGACAFCAGMRTDPADAMDLMLSSNLQPLEPYISAKEPWKCRCLGCGEIVFPLYNSIQQGQGGCTKCGIIRTADALRVSQEDAIHFARAAGFEPAEPYVGSEEKWKMKCLTCLKFFFPTLHNVRQGSGCPSCAKNGFDPNEKGYLYFLVHPIWEMFQIGITNSPDKRLRQHKKLGWLPLELRGPMDGHLTQNWETAILRMLKAKGADLSNGKIAGKFDGYSEAWSKSTFEVSSIKELMRLTEEFEGNV
jgi:hypothetical protein